MSEKTNREKMLDEEEYFPDKELADLAYECSEGLLLINSQPPRSLERQMFLQKFFGSIGSRLQMMEKFLWLTVDCNSMLVKRAGTVQSSIFLPKFLVQILALC